MTANLNLPQVAASQANKYITINDATAQLDGALTSEVSYNLTSASVTISSTDFQSNMTFIATNNSVTRSLTFPAIQRAFFLVENTGTSPLNVIVGSTTLSLAVSGVGYYQTDGTANGIKSIAPIGSVSADASKLQGRNIASTAPNNSQALVWVAGSSDWEPKDIAWDMGFFIPGKPTASKIVQIKLNLAITFPVTLTGSNFVIGTNPTSTMTFALTKNGSSIGSVAFDTSGVPTPTFASPVTFAAGDLFTLTCPASPDATGADISFNFRGIRQ